MKVAQLLGSLNTGGAEIMALNIFRRIHSSDPEIICIYRREGELLSDYLSTGIQLIQIKPVNYLFSALQLRRYLKLEKIDIVHAHQNIDSVIAHLATLFTPIKVVQTFHSHGLNYNWILRFFRWCSIRMNVKNIFVSNSQLKSFVERRLIKCNKGIVLYNSIILGKISESSEAGIKSELGISDDILLSGTVGNFSNGRDPMVICRFLAQLKRKGVHFYHVFVGAKMEAEPEIYNDCVIFCKNNNLQNQVHFLGSRTDVSAILSKLDAFIYSSAHDTFGMAVVEAIAAGIPVFVNDWEVMLEITGNGELATIYTSKDENDLMNKYLDYLNNQEHYNQKAIEASQIVREKHSIEKHITELKSIYKSILEN